MNIDWNAKTYKDSFSFVGEYGRSVVDLIQAPAGSQVVDLGCGNGMLTKAIADRGYRVCGIDASRDMLAQASKDYPMLSFICADACAFTLDEKADVIFSNAVFHWIDDQDALLTNIFGNLKPGGELVFEFGGKGCAEAVHKTLEDVFAEHRLCYPRLFYFPSIGQYAPLLEKHGFSVKYAVLFDRPTKQSGAHGVLDWINMFVKKAFEGIDQELAETIKQETEQRLKKRLFINNSWYIDYVRIRMRALRQPLAKE